MRHNSEMKSDSSKVQITSVKPMDFSKGKPIDAPPQAELRTFNEHDILGEFDRDEKGNVIVIRDSQGTYRDKRLNFTN